MNMSCREVLIHDRRTIKSYWEQIIERHCQIAENEDARMKNSALSKLRGEWITKLESRTKHLKSFNEDLLKKKSVAQMTSSVG
ncbi:protein FAM240C [Lepisosteus oculatus]|uniref:protein FAM240C n=1 Tax=Lepisosteus oculatus TaxID=7918 RepID=UPI003718E282